MTDASLMFELGCPACHTGTGSWPMRHLGRHDPTGWAYRQRRALLECTNPECRHAVLVEVTLIDVDNPGRTDNYKEAS